MKKRMSILALALFLSFQFALDNPVSAALRDHDGAGQQGGPKKKRGKAGKKKGKKPRGRKGGRGEITPETLIALNDFAQRIG